MRYWIECCQTVFGEERERRLKRAFDIIWNFHTHKTDGGQELSGKNSSASRAGAALLTDSEGISKEYKSRLPNAGSEGNE